MWNRFPRSFVYRVSSKLGAGVPLLLSLEVTKSTVLFLLPPHPRLSADRDIHYALMEGTSLRERREIPGFSACTLLRVYSTRRYHTSTMELGSFVAWDLPFNCLMSIFLGINTRTPISFVNRRTWLLLDFVVIEYPLCAAIGTVFAIRGEAYLRLI